jgi:hypothetical protein
MFIFKYFGTVKVKVEGKFVPVFNQVLRHEGVLG